VRYYGCSLAEGCIRRRHVYLQQIRLHKLLQHAGVDGAVFCEVSLPDGLIVQRSDGEPSAMDDDLLLRVRGPPAGQPVMGDFKVCVKQTKAQCVGLYPTEDAVLWFWLHSGYVARRVELALRELDGVKEQRHLFPKGFKVTAVFEEVQTSRDSYLLRANALELGSPRVDGR